jgi:nitroimidazol reductase NimA-like FMN-containing flavoprotein (pyridoxamine 5'-phosphate oxidase superfamily)
VGALAPRTQPGGNGLPVAKVLGMPHRKAHPSPGSKESAFSSAGTGPRVVERIDDAESMQLLRTERIGHLAYDSRYGPFAVPLEYEVVEDSIVFLTYGPFFTEQDLRTGIARAEYHVHVEVDHLDPERREGWMVVVAGPAHHVDDEAERAELARVCLEPWVRGESEHMIRVHPLHVGGQRISAA